MSNEDGPDPINEDGPDPLAPFAEITSIDMSGSYVRRPMFDGTFVQGYQGQYTGSVRVQVCANNTWTGTVYSADKAFTNARTWTDIQCPVTLANGVWYARAIPLASGWSIYASPPYPFTVNEPVSVPNAINTNSFTTGFPSLYASSPNQASGIGIVGMQAQIAIDAGFTEVRSYVNHNRIEVSGGWTYGYFTFDGRTPTGTAYVRVRSQDAYGTWGNWSTTFTVTITHVPSTDSYAPSGSTIINVGEPASGFTVPFTWRFLDPDSTDRQTAYTLTAWRASDPATTVTSGDVVTSVNGGSLGFPAAWATVPIHWKVRVRDVDNTWSAYSGNNEFSAFFTEEIAAGHPGGGRWSIVVHDPLTGAERALQEWQTLTITENADGVSASVGVKAADYSKPVDPNTLAIRELATDLLFYFDKVFLYRLRVINSSDTFSTEAHETTFECAAYDYMLKRRLLFKDFEVNGDQHDIAWSLVNYTQGFEDLGIRRAPDSGPSGKNRNRVIQRGKTVSEGINEIAEDDDGFDWWIDQHLLLHMATPRRLSDAGIDWYWGAEVASLTRQSASEAYASVIQMTGATNAVTLPSGTTYPPPNPEIHELQNKPVGRWEAAFSDSDIVTQASVNKKALWQLAQSSSLRPTYTVVLSPGLWNPVIRWGTVATLRIKSKGRLNIRVKVRIEELSLTIDVDGRVDASLACRAESPEEMMVGVQAVPDTFETPEQLASPPGAIVSNPTTPVGKTPLIARTTEYARLGQIIQNLDGRISRNERDTPGTSPWLYIGAAGQPGFQNGWSNYGNGYSGARFRRVGDKVQVEGLVNAGTLNATIFNLPAGFRPTAGAYLTPTDTASGHARIDVFTSGDLRILGGGGYGSIDCSFSVI